MCLCVFVQQRRLKPELTPPQSLTSYLSQSSGTFESHINTTARQADASNNGGKGSRIEWLRAHQDQAENWLLAVDTEFMCNVMCDVCDV